MSRVLIVEDDAWLAESEAASLRAGGYETLIVPHALAVMDAIDDAVPDVIVLDVLLGGATAFALLNELQSHPDTQRIPFILCTNLAEQLNSTDLAAYGVNRLVDKTTMHPDDLVAAVKAVLA